MSQLMKQKKSLPARETDILKNIPDLKSGIISLFIPADNRIYSNYMRGTVADDIRRNWEAIGNDFRLTIKKYRKQGRR